jgi:hypothetical protein
MFIVTLFGEHAWWSALGIKLALSTAYGYIKPSSTLYKIGVGNYGFNTAFHQT